MIRSTQVTDLLPRFKEKSYLSSGRCASPNGLVPHFFRGWMEGKVSEFVREVGLVFQGFEAQLFSTNVALEVAFGPEAISVIGTSHNTL